MRAMAIALVGIVTVAVLGWFWMAARGDRDSGLLRYRDRQVVAQGATLYAEYCASCHGADLEGQPDWRDRDAEGYLPAPPHDPVGHTWHHPDQQLFDITKYGTEQIVGGGYKSRMDGYAGVLTDDEIVAVLSFIKSRWPADIVDRHNRINRSAEVR